MKNPTLSPSNRYDFVAKILEILGSVAPGSVVYDIGAGDGRMRAAVEREGLKWCGFDGFAEAPGVQRWNLDEACPQSGERADLILLMDVIEHLRNPGTALEHIAAITKDEGRLVVTTPNPRWSRSRWHALLTGYLTCFTEDDLRLNSHVFPVWPHVMERLLDEAGFAVEDYVVIDGKTLWSPGPVGWNYPLRLLRTFCNKLVEFYDPSAAGMSYAVVARRKRQMDTAVRPAH